MIEYLSDSMTFMLWGALMGIPAGYALARAEDFCRRHRHRHRRHG